MWWAMWYMKTICLSTLVEHQFTMITVPTECSTSVFPCLPNISQKYHYDSGIIVSMETNAIVCWSITLNLSLLAYPLYYHHRTHEFPLFNNFVIAICFRFLNQHTDHKRKCFNIQEMFWLRSRAGIPFPI